MPPPLPPTSLVISPRDHVGDRSSSLAPASANRESRGDLFFFLFPRPCARPKPRFLTFSRYLLLVDSLFGFPFYFILFFVIFTPPPLLFSPCSPARFAPVRGLGRVAINRQRDELLTTLYSRRNGAEDGASPRTFLSRKRRPPESDPFGKIVDLSRGRETDVRSADETLGGGREGGGGLTESDSGRRRGESAVFFFFSRGKDDDDDVRVRRYVDSKRRRGNARSFCFSCLERER